MRPINWLIFGVLPLLGVCSTTALAQPPDVFFRRAQPPIQIEPGPPPLPGFGIPGELNRSHIPVPGEEQLNDLRGWLDGSLKGRGKPNVDPKGLADMLAKLKQAQQNGDPNEAQNLLRNDPRFKDPEFLKLLERLKGDPEFLKRLQGQLGDLGKGVNPDIQLPDLKDRFGDLINQAKKNVGQDNGGGIPDGKFPDVGGNNGDNFKLPDGQVPINQPKLDPAMQEWVKWLEKNFGNSPAGKQAVDDFVKAMSNGKMKGIFDDLNLKGGDWNKFNEWGKGNFGKDWNFRPPDWNLSGGGSGPKLNFGGGPNWNFGGGPNVGTISAPSAAGAQGGISVIAVVIGIAGAIFLAVLLYRKFQKDQEAKLALEESLKSKLDLSNIRSREELVEAFNALTVEKCGPEAKIWNHRVVTQTWVESAPQIAEPAQELGELYQKARYAPPQDDMTNVELSSAEKDLKAVARVST